MEPERAISEGEKKGLRFFGRVTAGITHQIKNELAVINETGNLIAEIMAMAEQGREFDPGRIGELAQRVVKRVESSNRMVKRLNKFANSAEDETDLADVAQTLELMVDLFQRPAGFKKVRLGLEPFSGDDPPQVGVNPFVLERIMWGALEAALEEARPGGSIGVSLSRTGGKLLLKLSGEFAEPPSLPPGELPAGSSMEARSEAGALYLEFPS